MTVDYDKSISAKDICERLAKTINFVNTASLRQNLTVKLAVDDILHALKTRNVTLRIDSDLIDVALYVYMHNEWKESITTLAAMPRRPGFTRLLNVYNAKATELFQIVHAARSKLLPRLFDSTKLTDTVFDENKDSCYAFIAYHYKDGYVNLDLPQEDMKSCFRFVQSMLFFENDNSKLTETLKNTALREIALFLVGTLHFSQGPNDSIEKATAFLDVFNGGILKRYTTEASVKTVMRKARLIIQLEVYQQDEEKLLAYIETQPDELKTLIEKFQGLIKTDS
ncbi:hypothetical protein HDE_06213 [Halotydeus destructor]|nr:hypothetical protein HDE_06213 [Halotydeus destructor]